MADGSIPDGCFICLMFFPDGISYLAKSGVVSLGPSPKMTKMTEMKWPFPTGAAYEVQPGSRREGFSSTSLMTRLSFLATLRKGSWGDVEGWGGRWQEGYNKSPEVARLSTCMCFAAQCI